MAMACFGFVTFLPLRPDFSLPFFIARISRFTSLPAEGEYLRLDDFFFDELFREEVLLREPVLLRAEELFFALLLLRELVLLRERALLFFALDFFELLLRPLDFFLVAMHYPPSNSDVCSVCDSCIAGNLSCEKKKGADH